MKYLSSALLAAALALAAASAAAAQPAGGAQEVDILVPGGGVPTIQALIPGFEAKTGYKVKLTQGTGQGTKKQITSGEVFDVAVLQPPLQDVLASGNLVAKSQKMLFGTVMGVAVKKGAPKPDISTPDAVKKLLLSVKSFAYPDPEGGSAAALSFAATLEKMGLTQVSDDKARLEKGSNGVMKDTVRGDADIGITFLSDMDDPGVDIVGPLPAAISPPLQLFGFVHAHAKNPAGAQALLDYLISPAAIAYYTSKHLQPSGG